MTDLTAMAALPPYLRLAEALAIEIAAGRLKTGDRLPPERAMAKSHGLSVTTLRKTLATLEARGLIERRHGSGNYITGGRDQTGTYALFRLERHPQGGGLPSADLIAVSRAPLPQPWPPFASGGRTAWNIRRLRRLDTIAVALEDIWLADQPGMSLGPDILSESLYKTYRDRFGLTIHHVEDSVRVGPLPDWAPPELNAPPGMQMGLVERRAFDGYGHVVERSLTWFDPTTARYHARHP